MKHTRQNKTPIDGEERKKVKPVICYPVNTLPLPDMVMYGAARKNLVLEDEADLPLHKAETYVHDVLNVFMCTGFTHDTHQYFMKASPVRPGDFIEFFAEIDLIAGLSTCPGGDCSSEHSSDKSNCYPLKVEIFKPDAALLKGWSSPERSRYSQSHGC